MDDASITFQLTCVRDINSGANTVIKCAGRSSGIKYKVGTGEKRCVCVCENVCGPKHPWPLTGLVFDCWQSKQHAAGDTAINVIRTESPTAQGY